MDAWPGQSLSGQSSARPGHHVVLQACGSGLGGDHGQALSVSSSQGSWAGQRTSPAWRGSLCPPARLGGCSTCSFGWRRNPGHGDTPRFSCHRPEAGKVLRGRDMGSSPPCAMGGNGTTQRARGWFWGTGAPCRAAVPLDFHPPACAPSSPVTRICRLPTAGSL